MRTFRQYLRENLESIYEDYKAKQYLVKRRNEYANSYKAGSNEKVGKKEARAGYKGASRAIGHKNLARVSKSYDKGMRKVGKTFDKVEKYVHRKTGLQAEWEAKRRKRLGPMGQRNRNNARKQAGNRVKLLRIRKVKSRALGMRSKSFRKRRRF